jgi:DNA polymerase-3 subunit alpha
MDSLMWDMSFERFMNPLRQGLADIDLDIQPSRRQEARGWFFNHPQLNSSDILTFGTVAYKGACDTIIRTSELTKQQGEQLKEMYADIRTEFELSDSDLFREKLPISIDELAKRMGDYGGLIRKVILLEGCTVSVGSHPAGVLVTDLDIRKKIGIITMEDKETGDYKLVSQCDMKELDYMGYVKADALGLSTVGAINKTVKYLGQEFPEPQHFDFHDEKVWEDIKKSPCMIFQFEETKAHDYMKVALDLVDIDKKLYTMSMMSGLIRPSGKTVRDSFLRGEKGGSTVFPKTCGAEKP